MPGHVHQVLHKDIGRVPWKGVRGMVHGKSLGPAAAGLQHGKASMHEPQAPAETDQTHPQHIGRLCSSRREASPAHHKGKAKLNPKHRRFHRCRLTQSRTPVMQSHGKLGQGTVAKSVVFMAVCNLRPSKASIFMRWACEIRCAGTLDDSTASMICC